MKETPAYRPTEIGCLPDDWEVGEAGDHIDLLTGFPFPSSGYTAAGIRLLRGSNVKRGRTDWSDEITHHWPKVDRSISRYELRDGDLVIAMDGALVGRSYAQLTSSDLPALLLQRVARIRSAKLAIHYFASLVGSESFVRYVDSVKTETAIPHISPADIRKFVIPIPPTIEEQRAIAGAIEDAGALLTALDQLIVKKRAIKQGAMQQLLTGGRRLPGFKEDWTSAQIGDLVEVRYGRRPLSLRREGGLYPVFGSSGVIGRTDEFLYDKPSVLIGRKGTIDRPLYVDRPFWAIDTMFYTETRAANAKFLYYQFCMVDWRSKNEASGVPSLTVPNIASVTLGWPERDEQAAIATVLSSMDAEIAALHARRAKTAAIRQGMMQALLTGRIRLPIDNEELAA